MDRVFIIPEVRDQRDAVRILRQHLDNLWREEHYVVAEQLIGFPGAFIREVAIYALTRVAYDDLNEMSLEILEDSFGRLRKQVEARDNFLVERVNLGFLSRHAHRN